MDGHRSCFGSRAIITSRRCTGSAWAVMPSGARCGRSPSRSRHRTGAGAMQASDSSALSQDDHFLPNLPRLSFRVPEPVAGPGQSRSEEHTSELQSLMRLSYAVFCLKKKKKKTYQDME